MLNSYDREKIAEELHRVFLLVGITVTKERLTFLLNEIYTKYATSSLEDILDGLNRLAEKGLTKIRWSDICEVMSSNTVDEITYPCRYCGGIGVVSLVDEKGYSWTYACCCRNGDKYPYFARWYGEAMQDNKVFYFADLYDLFSEK